MTTQEMFVTRLRRHREHSKISLHEIAANMRVKVDLLEAFERNDLSKWPRGLYARAWMRAYADALGLDRDSTVNEFCRLFPHGDRRIQATIEEMAAIVAHRSQFHDEMRPTVDRRRALGPPAPEPPVPWHAVPVRVVRALLTRFSSNPATPYERMKRAPRTSG
jgi:hypothetical protein